VPFVHQSFTPLPVDGRHLFRVVRLAVGSAICAVIGHSWRRVSPLIRVRSVWVPEARQHITLRSQERHRTCQRCEARQVRIVGGKWRADV